jgi:hypothetical protein
MKRPIFKEKLYSFYRRGSVTIIDWNTIIGWKGLCANTTGKKV